MPELKSVPPPDETIDCEMPDGAVVRVRRYLRANSPRLIASHGNGFAIDAYWPFLLPFLQHFEVVVFDLRNHGQNPRHEISHHRIERFASDLEVILDAIQAHFGPRDSVGVFHSVSAITALLHGLRYDWRWQALVAVDPPLLPSPGHHLYAMAHAAELRLSDWAASRKEQFETTAAFADVLANARSNQGWVAGAATLLANAVLRFDAGIPGWVLACPGAFESQIYADNADLNLAPALRSLPGPLMFACADASAPGAWAPARVNAVLSREHGHHYEAFPGTSHMLQLEQPGGVADRVLAFFARTGAVPPLTS